MHIFLSNLYIYIYNIDRERNRNTLRVGYILCINLIHAKIYEKNIDNKSRQNKGQVHVQTIRMNTRSIQMLLMKTKVIIFELVE